MYKTLRFLTNHLFTTALCLASVPALAQPIAADKAPQLPTVSPANTRQSSASVNSPATRVTLQQNEGWQGLANLLHRLEPSTDTSLPESRSQTAERISQLISKGRAKEALAEIKKLQTEDAYITELGTDVQLRFLEGRAYWALDQIDDAIGVYRDMASKYPELAEPWNNMGVLQLKKGLLDVAYESFNMAITVRANYNTAQRNLGVANLLMARRAFDKASQGGNSQDSRIIEAIDLILNGKAK